VKTLQIETREELERRNGRTKKVSRLGAECDAHGPNGRRRRGGRLEAWFSTGGGLNHRRRCLLPPAKSREDGCTRWQARQGIIEESSAKKRGDKPVKHTGQARTKEFASWMAHSSLCALSSHRPHLQACMGSLAQSFRDPSQRDWETHSR
jgi:hypothetical protein